LLWARFNPATCYQLKIALKGLHPVIWRRVRVPSEFTLADLHNIIQIVMPWEDSHLHSFTIRNTEFGIPSPDGWGPVHDERKVLLGSLAFKPKEKFGYEYDFGDSWIHEIHVEKVETLESPLQRPECLAGKHACPPEDCGGSDGYCMLMEMYLHPEHPGHEEALEWLDEGFDPMVFDAEAADRHLEFAFKPKRSRKKAALKSGV
jgi:hypothetical protein